MGETSRKIGERAKNLLQPRSLKGTWSAAGMDGNHFSTLIKNIDPARPTSISTTQPILIYLFNGFIRGFTRPLSVLRLPLYYT